MTAKWEPLTTAEDVLKALKAKRWVEFRNYRGRVWRRVCLLPYSEGFIQGRINEGKKYRALVESEK